MSDDTSLTLMLMVIAFTVGFIVGRASSVR